METHLIRRHTTAGGRSPAQLEQRHFQRLTSVWKAAVVIEAWRKHYNTVRPHSSLDYMTPHEFKQHQLHNPPIPNRAVLQE